MSEMGNHEQSSIDEAKAKAQAEKDARQLEMERDGFFKTAVIAYAANFWAHNTPIDPAQIVAKAAMMAELTWEELLKYRKRQAK